MNLATNLERFASYFTDRTANVEENRQISFLEFNHDSKRVATALINLGVRKVKHVALCVANSYQ